MTRDWFAVHTRLLRLPKFRRLPPDTQLSLLYVWLLAGDETPEGRWPKTGTLAELLEFHGRPANAVDDLIAAGWLDVNDDGQISVHDWDEWQWAASAKARNAWEAAYMRKWRAEKREKAETPSPAPLPHNTGSPTPYTHTNSTEGPTRKQRVDNGSERLGGNGLGQPSLKGGMSSVTDVLMACVKCGQRVEESQSRVIHHDGRPRLIHEGCYLPVAS